MVKRSTVILTIAMLALGVSTCFGYTVSQWPVPGIPNVAFCPGAPTLAGAGADDTVLRGPVAPACEAPLIPGLLHAAMSISMRIPGYVLAFPLAGSCPGGPPCGVELGEPAYVTAAVPCTPVNLYTPPKGY
jgi:hypothetical protein